MVVPRSFIFQKWKPMFGWTKIYNNFIKICFSNNMVGLKWEKRIVVIDWINLNVSMMKVIQIWL